jgi:hypothetical protein
VALILLIDPDHLVEAEVQGVEVGHLDRLLDVGCVYGLQHLLDVVDALGFSAVVGQEPIFVVLILIDLLVRKFKECIAVNR